MRRRTLLSSLGAGFATGLAGCSETREETTTTVSPERSVLRIRVENNEDTPRDVSFQLQVTTPGPDNAYLFRITDVQPGSTRTTDPRELDAGEYELQVRLPLGSTTIRWTGVECSEKLVVIRFTESGEVVSDRCPATA